MKALLRRFNLNLPRAPWHVWFTVVSVGMLLASVNAYSDTYNFYFGKKKKNGQVEEVVEDETGEEATAETPAPEEQKQTVNVPAGQAPIVIHNNNHVGTVSSSQSTPVTTPAPAPIVSEPPVSGPVLSSGTHLAETLEEPSERSPWKISLSAIVLAEEMDRAYSSQGQLQTYSSLEPTVGGLVTLGYNFSRVFGVNVYGGLRVNENADSNYHAGVDLELIPFRIPITRDIDLFELGILVGGSTAMAAPGNVGSLHVGVRTNINIARSFGLTASGRANLGYVMFEAGLVARL